MDVAAHLATAISVAGCPDTTRPPSLGFRRSPWLMDGLADVRVDERALREIYLPPFAAAVRDGDVAAVRGSYDKINGVG